MIKLNLYPHVRQFIERQELYGNIVKFAAYEPRFLYVYQTEPYKGYPPHVFVWNVLSRRVVRRVKGQVSQFTFDNMKEKV